MRYPDHLLKLINVLRRLPGVGHKSAERFAFHLLDWPAGHLQELGQTVMEVKDKLKACQECGCLVDELACAFCDLTKRDSRVICVIASPRDAFTVEDTREYNGLYHVLGGVLSPLEKRGADLLSFEKLRSRIQTLNIQEVVIGLDSTLEGDTTSLFLKQELTHLNVRLSRLAFGLPMGSSLDYVDGGTLARALSGRSNF